MNQEILSQCKKYKLVGSGDSWILYGQVNVRNRNIFCKILAMGTKHHCKEKKQEIESGAAMAARREEQS